MLYVHVRIATQVVNDTPLGAVAAAHETGGVVANGQLASPALGVGACVSQSCSALNLASPDACILVTDTMAKHHVNDRCHSNTEALPCYHPTSRRLTRFTCYLTA